MLYYAITGILAALVAALAGLVLYMRREWKRTEVLQHVGLQLNSTIRRKELLNIIMETAAETMRAEGSSIILVDQDTGELYFEVATGDKNEEIKEIRLQPGEGIAGWVAQTGKSVLIGDAANDPRWSGRVSSKLNIPTRNMMCVPVVSNGAILGVLQVINRKGNRNFTRRDLRLLEMIASPTAVALENMFLYEALMETMEHVRETTAARERMESELKIARDIQRSLLPGEHLAMGGVRIHARLHPAREVGGDFYHFIPLDGGKLLFCLGDVSDKGIPSALFMSSLMIRIQSKAEAGRTPARILDAVNREVAREDSTMFATIFLAVLDTRTGRFLYCDGGHCTPVIAGAEGARKLETKKHLPIGIYDDVAYEDREAELAPGETLVLYTDGITEAENGSGEWFTAERLRASLEAAAGLAPEEMAERLIGDVRKFAAGFPQSDDIAIMMIRYSGNPDI